MLLARCDRCRVHVSVFGAAVSYQAARHLGKRHDRHSARYAAQGRRLVVRKNDHGPRALVHRRNLRTLPARGDDNERLRGHGRRPSRRLPGVAGSIRRPPGGVDDFARVRHSVPDDSSGRVGGRPDRQLPPASSTWRGDDGVWHLRLLPEAQAAGGTGGRSESRLVGAHVSHDVRRTNRIRAGVPLVRSIVEDVFMSRRTIKSILIALVAAFTLTSLAEAAPPRRHRAVKKTTTTTITPKRPARRAVHRRVVHKRVVRRAPRKPTTTKPR